ncbi:MAG: ABC transporter permease [Bacteroidetes bacterium]|nr:ABC transporter permease [Bacteroidota bacterium]
MLKNYLRYAWASIRRDKIFSFINIFGLAFGMSLCMLLITIIKDQLGYDKFHPAADRTYRINTEAIRKDGGTEPYASTPLPISIELKKDYPFIDHVATLTRGLNGEAGSGEKTININGFLSNKEFFNVFGYEMMYGNKETSLNAPRSVVLTQKTARKFFPMDEHGEIADPVGKTISIKKLGDFIVTGVLKELTGKTHLEFDLIGSDNFLPTLDKDAGPFTVSGNWLNYYGSYTYVTLKDKTYKPALEKALNTMSAERYKNLQLESRDRGYHFYLQPLTKIVPGPNFSNNMGKAMPVEILWFLGVFASIIIISASFNYNSLTLAHALSRAKEIGIRKATGAQRYQLVSQFLVQSVFTSVLGMLVALALYQVALIPLFKSFSLFNNFNISLSADLLSIVIFFLLSLLIGLIAGLFPALYLSSFNPSKALKDSGSSNFLPKLGLRKVLLVVQFSAALLFVITLTNMYRQMNYVTNADYGFRKDDIINIDLQGNDYALVKQNFTKQNGVVKISGISHSIGTWADRSEDVRTKKEADKLTVRDYSVDEDYLYNLSLKLVAGQGFTKDMASTHERYVIVNEEFTKFFKLGTSEEAVGKQLILGDSTYVSIAGVLKDFHFKPFTYKIEPLMLRYRLADISQLNVQVSHGNAKQTLAGLQKVWNSIDKKHAFTYRFFENELKDTYTMHNDLTKFVAIVAFMAVIIACMGLLGLVLFILKQRVKEVGIRKILGASVTQLSILLSKNFAKLLLIACLIGLPVGVLLNEKIFQEFAYKINLISGYIIGVIVLFILAAITIGSQIIKTAFVNPVKSLRTE